MAKKGRPVSAGRPLRWHRAAIGAVGRGLSIAAIGMPGAPPAPLPVPIIGWVVRPVIGPIPVTRMIGAPAPGWPANAKTDKHARIGRFCRKRGHRAETEHGDEYRRKPPGAEASGQGRHDLPFPDDRDRKVARRLYGPRRHSLPAVQAPLAGEMERIAGRFHCGQSAGSLRQFRRSRLPQPGRGALPDVPEALPPEEAGAGPPGGRARAL